MSGRDKKDKTPSERAYVLRMADDLARETLRLICKEKAFPKRSRWLISGKIADIANDYHSAVMTANGVKVTTIQEYEERHRLQTLAVAHLYALNAKMGLAQAVLSLDANTMDAWAGRFNAADRATKAWMTADVKRYGAMLGLLGNPANHGEAAIETPGRSPNPSNGNNERNVNPSGSLNNNNANNTNGVVPDREKASDE